MGYSYTKGAAKASITPAEWMEEVQHKYCRAVDIGREGKANKVHRCQACLAIKGRKCKWSGGEKGIKEGVQKKMNWHQGTGVKGEWM